MIAWGSNAFEQQQLPAALAAGGVRAIAAGGYHSNALLCNGTVVSWGGEFDGGPGMLGPEPVPLAAQANVTQIAAGLYHSLAVTVTGQVVGWFAAGVDLEISDYGQATMPAALAACNVTAVAAGGYHSLALLDTGEVVAWGSNHYGQINVPESVKSSVTVGIAASLRSSLALLADGRVEVWGDGAALDGYAQVGGDLLYVGHILLTPHHMGSWADA